MLRTLTPAIEGANCYGGDKKLRVEAFLTKAGIAREAAHIRFYSDHDSDLPIFEWADEPVAVNPSKARSEEHTSELQSLMRISYAVFCLKKTNHTKPPAINK